MNNLLEQSVIYQAILQRGFEKGELSGLECGELKFLLIMLEHRFGTLTRPMRKQIETLTVTQAEALGKAAFDFKSKDDLRNWLKQTVG